LSTSYELRARVALTSGAFQYAHALGQNFILDEGLLSSLIDASGVAPDDCVLEIGTGAGVMTALLSERCAQVVGIEIDRRLEPVLAEVLAGRDNVHIVYADAMHADIAQIAREHFGARDFRVVANLPYYITSDILMKLVSTGLPITDIGVMVQKEAAERILSQPDTKRWCALAAMIAYYGEPSVIRHVPRAAFFPRPHIDSAFLRIALFPEKPHPAKSDDMMLRVVAAAFRMRRKKLANNLRAAFSLNQADALALLAAAGIDPDVRGEALDIAALARLSDALTEHEHAR
jgi:16S rRNA (adenine1518-N6/adenine1519-N6)-dimethyltransferase